MNLQRIRQLVAGSIATFDLDLRGLAVLTEAATGHFVVTPLIAALGGADRVFALTRDSIYGTARLAETATRQLAKEWNVDSQVEILVSRDDSRIASADIVTNLGFVRPLDAAFLRLLKPAAVIPLMWETWEWRPDDLDLGECRRRGIPVLGTNEHHPDLETITYIGHLALKLVMEAEIEVFRSRIVVLGSGEFANHTARTLMAAGAEVSLLPRNFSFGRLDSDTREQIRLADVMVVVEHHVRDLLIGPGGLIEAAQLAAISRSLTVVHICGGVDRDALRHAGLACHPGRFAPAGHMSVTTAYVGPRPLIELHTAGLKVGETMARARAQGFDGTAAERWAAARCPLAQLFGSDIA